MQNISLVCHMVHDCAWWLWHTWEHQDVDDNTQSVQNTKLDHQMFEWKFQPQFSFEYDDQWYNISYRIHRINLFSIALICDSTLTTPLIYSIYTNSDLGQIKNDLPWQYQEECSLMLMIRYPSVSNWYLSLGPLITWFWLVWDIKQCFAVESLTNVKSPIIAFNSMK